MNIWVTADDHFGHANVIKYSNRPFRDVVDMEDKLVKNWNHTVGKDDLVYVLGDFTLSRRIDEISRLAGLLQGRKVLIMGNHDTRKPKDYIACGFTTAIRRPILYEPRVVLMHEPPQESDILSGMCYIFGHVHNLVIPIEEHPNCKCVCVERTDYKPVNLSEIISKMKPYLSHVQK